MLWLISQKVRLLRGYLFRSSLHSFVMLSFEWALPFILEKEMAAHSNVLAWRIPGMGEPGGLLSMGSHRAGHDWNDLAATFKYFLLGCIPFSECIFYRWSGWRRKSKVWWGGHVPGYSQFLPLCLASSCGPKGRYDIGPKQPPKQASQAALVVTNPPANARDVKRWGFESWMGKILWSRKWHLFQYSCLENSMDRGAWWWGRKESDATEHTQPPMHRVTFPLRLPPPQLIWGST